MSNRNYLEGEVNKECIKKAEISCRYASPVQFMLEQLKTMGCEISVKNKRLLCEPCGPQILGGFDPDSREVVLCQNNLQTQQQYNAILTHELIHAFDVCRVKYETDNLKHLACSEVRAANLSGSCSMWSEVMTSLRVKAQHQACVKRNAVNSIVCVKSISRHDAEKIVESIFNDCFNDISPFKTLPH